MNKSGKVKISTNRKPHMIALIDNYDSFTYNVYQIVSRLIADKAQSSVQVFRNDKITLDELEKLQPSHIIISPGPGVPAEAGISLELVKYFAGRIPILGICLGHQCIGEAFGAKIVQAKKIMHGKVEPINLDGRGLLRNLPNPCPFTRYHSLAVPDDGLPAELEITARSSDGEIMGLRHREHVIEGVQFHPESIGSPYGERLLANFLNWRRESVNKAELLNKAIDGQNLSIGEAESFMDELTDGVLEDSWMAAMLAALSSRPFAAEELYGCAMVLIKKCQSVNLNLNEVVDIVGTGGDGLSTFNISSFSALLAAGCGLKVAKHGNRAVSSLSGSTDFFIALGIPTNLGPEEVAENVRNHGFAYMAAPNFHSAMRYAAPVRKAMGIKTIMNCLGPLVNPARVDYQIIGVYDEDLLKIMARAACMLGVKRVWTIHSEDGMDEISPVTKTRIFRIDEEGRESEELFDPASVGVKGHCLDDLIGKDGEENARVAVELLEGGGPQAIRDAVCLNTGAAMALAGMVQDVAEGFTLAGEALKNGVAREKFHALRG